MQILYKGKPIFSFQGKTEQIDTSIDSRLVPAWEFPDPIMQDDADKRREIAELTAQVSELTAQVSTLETVAIWDESLKRREQAVTDVVKAAYANVEAKIEYSVKLRVNKLERELSEVRSELALLKSKGRVA